MSAAPLGANRRRALKALAAVLAVGALAARGVPLAFLPVLSDGERAIAYGRLSERRLQKDLAA